MFSFRYLDGFSSLRAWRPPVCFLGVLASEFARINDFVSVPPALVGLRFVFAWLMTSLLGLSLVRIIHLLLISCGDIAVDRGGIDESIFSSNVLIIVLPL